MGLSRNVVYMTPGSHISGKVREHDVQEKNSSKPMAFWVCLPPFFFTHSLVQSDHPNKSWANPAAKGHRRCQRLRGEGHERWQGGGGGSGRELLQVGGSLRDVGPGLRDAGPGPQLD